MKLITPIEEESDENLKSTKKTLAIFTLICLIFSGFFSFLAFFTTPELYKSAFGFLTISIIMFIGCIIAKNELQHRKIMNEIRELKR